MTLSSAYIELFIRGESSGGNVRGGGMSGYRIQALIHVSYLCTCVPTCICAHVHYTCVHFYMHAWMLTYNFTASIL